MPAVSQQSSNQQSAFSFYSSQKKKKLSVPMKKKKKNNMKGKSTIISKAVQSLSNQAHSFVKNETLVVQAKTPILAKPDLSKQITSGKSLKPGKTRKLKNNDSKSKHSASIHESKSQNKECSDSAKRNKSCDKDMRKPSCSQMPRALQEGKNFDTCLADFISSIKNSTTSDSKESKTSDVSSTASEKKVMKKFKAPPVPVVVKKRIPLKKIDVDQTSSSGSVQTKVLKKGSSSSNTSMAKLLQQITHSGDTKKSGLTLLSYLLAPHDPKVFFKSYWESKPLLIQRKNPCYFDGLFSTEIFDSILREQYVEYTKNLDVTSYSDNERLTHNPSGRAYSSVVWDYFSNGCSLRMLNPQTFCEPVWLVLTLLQEYMGSFCGTNMYLTPAGTQGFAPHWDDIEAFILQLEGKKRWRVYKPRNVREVLPRYSSSNLTQEEIGKPIIDVVLNSGDILYFPRGFIHQAEAVEDTHSLHITISMYQKNAWVDLFEKMFSTSSLNQIAVNNASIRKGLPLGCLDYMGVTAASFTSKITATKKSKHAFILEHRKKFRQEVSSLVSSMLTDEVIDRAMDEMGRQFVRVALPPCLAEDDQDCTVELDGERWEGGRVRGRVEVDPDTRIKLLASMALRVVHDPSNKSEEYRIYHSVENSREYEGREEQFVVVDRKHLPAVQHLILSYPEYTVVEDLPLSTLEEKLTVAMSLWEQHLVITEHPLNAVDEDSADSSSDIEQ